LTNKPHNWIEYWDTQNISDESEVMLEMQSFIKAAEPVLHFAPQDKVLDIGCGTGTLESCLKSRVKELHGVDTSIQCIESCRKKFTQDQNCHFYSLDLKDYTNLSCLESKGFTIAICLSVIQYYQTIDDVMKLISEVRKVMAPGGRFLISDIYTKTSTLADVRALLKAGLREHRLLKTIVFLIRARFSEYSKLRSSLGLLVLSKKEIMDIIDRLGLDGEMLTTKLTRMESRSHLLIRF
jgi:ubiquinone/menaquinone biosynthesis C-methylase UbiE